MRKTTRRALRYATLLREAIISLVSTPGRTALGAMSTCLGAAAAIAVIGVSVTSAAQVSEAFNAYEQTQVLIRPASGDTNDLDWKAVDRFLPLEGVVSATALGETTTSAIPIGLDPFDVELAGAQVTAVDKHVAQALELGDWQGRPLDDGFHERGDAVAILGQVAARNLGLAPPHALQAVTIDGRRVTVLGVFGASPRLPQLIERVLVPRTWAQREQIATRVDQLVIRTRVGAAETIAQHAAALANPYQPDTLLVSAPPTIERLRQQVSQEIDLLVAYMAAGAVLVGSLGIAHATFVSVLRRQGEFALRQALGSTSADLALLVLHEGAFLGFVAGAVGAVAGTTMVVVIAAMRGWTPLLDVRWVLAAAGLATVLGSVNSLYPAMRAARVEPAVGLRHLGEG